jgi:predicted DNA-binding transcriptional regulator YafY
MDYTKRVHRLLRILTLVQSEREWTPKKLVEELGVTERTLYRDLDTLKTAGIPIAFDRETNQYRIVGAFFMPPVQVTVEEALALCALCEHIGDNEQIPFLKPAVRAMQKLESQLPTAVQENLAEQSRDVAIRTGPAMPPDGYKDVYDTVRDSLARRRKLLCRYDAVHAEGDPDGTFEFSPYALFFSVRAWYVIGLRSDRDGLRCLKLNRFTKVTPLDKPYMVPDDFSIEGFLGNAWRMMRGPDVEVELHFDPEFAQTISDTMWHKTQSIDWHEDDSCTFKCKVSGLEEIEWWVLSMGPHCRVVQPAALAQRVRDLAGQTAGLYA